MNKKRKKLPVLLIKEENEYIVFCPDLSVVNQSKTVNSALFKVKQGVELFLDEMDNKNDIIHFINN